MNRIGIVGIDWRHSGPEGIARYTVPADERLERLPRLREEIGVRELVYVATCNRVEVVFVTASGTPVAAIRPRVFSALRGREPRPREAETELAAWGGEGAAEHLFLLVSGLQSAMLGEREIVGQLREAVEQSTQAATKGPILDWLFDEAFKLSRRVHRLTALGEGKVSIAELAMSHVRERLARQPGTVVLVGVSPMILHCARALAQEHVPTRIFNRTPAKARNLAAKFGHRRGDGLEMLRAGLSEEVAVVVLATGAPEPVLDRPHLERLAASQSGHTPLIVDLATPPDVDPKVARLVGLERIGMQEILVQAEGHRRGREEAGEAARELVAKALVDLDTKLVDRVIAPLLAALQRRYRATAERGVERLLRKELAGVDAETELAVRRWAEVLARRFAHLPTAGLRALATQHGFRVLESFFAAADGALAEELKRLQEADDRPLPPGLEVELPVPSTEVLG